MNRDEWYADTSWATVVRRAAGRARYNQERQIDAAIRRIKIEKFIAEYHADGGRIFDWGLQSELAKRLGVHRSTICRDFPKIMSSLAARFEQRLAEELAELEDADDEQELTTEELIARCNAATARPRSHFAR
jgi:hypothetical protein